MQEGVGNRPRVLVGGISRTTRLGGAARLGWAARFSGFSMKHLKLFFPRWSKIESAMSTAYSIILKPIFGGWAVCLSDGRELARFRGPAARCRALRFLHTQFMSGGTGPRA
jgi:hypothetical protein